VFSSPAADVIECEESGRLFAAAVALSAVVVYGLPVIAFSIHVISLIGKTPESLPLWGLSESVKPLPLFLGVSFSPVLITELYGLFASLWVAFVVAQGGVSLAQTALLGGHVF
jgi:hypothetical protein